MSSQYYEQFKFQSKNILSTQEEEAETQKKRILSENLEDMQEFLRKKNHSNNIGLNKVKNRYTQAF